MCERVEGSSFNFQIIRGVIIILLALSFTSLNKLLYLLGQKGREA